MDNSCCELKDKKNHGMEQEKLTKYSMFQRQTKMYKPFEFSHQRIGKLLKRTEYNTVRKMG